MGHGHKAVKIPHPSIYKVADVPQLEEVRIALRRQGLTDPWLRNEVWRFNSHTFGTRQQRIRTCFTRGLLYGTILTAATIAVETLIGSNSHHHDEGEKEASS